MAAEGNIGARITIIGKAVALATMKELTAANQAFTDSVIAGQEEQKVGYATLAEAQTAYRAKLAETTAASQAANKDAAITVGKGVALGLAAIIGVVTYEGIKNATVLQKNLTLLQTQAGMTAAAVQKIKTAAMGNNLGATPENYAAAAYAPASTGFNAAATINIVNQAQKESIISGANLTDTVNSLTSTMKSYNMAGSQAAKTQAQLNAIVGAGNMHFQDFNEAMKSGIASTSALSGVSLPSMGAMLAYLTDRGTPAAQAGTRLRMTEALMASPTAEAAKVGAQIIGQGGLTTSDVAGQTSGMSDALKLAGVNQSKLADDMRKPDGLMVALQDLKTHMDAAHVSTELQAASIYKLFGGGRSGTVAVTGFQNLAGVAAKYQQIVKGSTTGAFNSDFSKAMDTQAAKVKVLDANWHAFSITLGKDLLPVVSVLTGALAGVMGWLGHNQVALVALAGLLTAVVGPAIGVYLTSKFFAAGGAISKVIGFYGDVAKKILQHLGLMGTDAAATEADTVATEAQSTALGANDGMLAANDASLAANDTALAANTAARTGGAGLAVAGAAGIAVPAAAAGYIGWEAGRTGNPIGNTLQSVGNKVPFGPKYGPDGFALGSPLSKYNANGTPKAKPPSTAQQNAGASPSLLSNAWFAQEWHGLFGGGSQPNVKAVPAVAPHGGVGWTSPADTVQIGPGGLTHIVHTTVNLDGKTIATAVQAQTKKQAARN